MTKPSGGMDRHIAYVKKEREEKDAYFNIYSLSYNATVSDYAG
jgi:hypothetical protein